MGWRSSPWGVTSGTSSVRLESQDFECDNVHVYELRGHERISEPFRFEVDVACLDDEGLDVSSMVAASVTLVFLEGDTEVRRLHGQIQTVEDRLETQAKHHSYRLVVVPRLCRLLLIETLDIHIDMSVPDIVRKKLELVSLQNTLDDRLIDSYPKREFIVQYRESDLAFLSRLLEHLGISYIFRHDDEEDRVQLVDSAGQFPALGTEVQFSARGEQSGVHRIVSRTTVIPTTYVVRDYNYRTPQVDIAGQYRADVGYAGGVVEFGNHTKSTSEAERMARVRGEEREARQLVYEGDSDIVAFTAGAKFHLTDHPRLEEELLVVSVEHRLVQPQMSSGAQTEPPSYRNSFVAIPASRTYRPPRVTPVPRIHGAITGIIERPVGASNRFPLIDEQGRYTVRFVFDTAVPGERQASHPVRLAQLSAGTRYGTHFPLRPGVEVIVVFIDGDPDRPIIAGAVPNPETSTPVTASEALKSRIKSESGVIIEFSDR